MPASHPSPATGFLHGLPPPPWPARLLFAVQRHRSLVLASLLALGMLVSVVILALAVGGADPRIGKGAVVVAALIGLALCAALPLLLRERPASRTMLLTAVRSATPVEHGHLLLKLNESLAQRHRTVPLSRSELADLFTAVRAVHGDRASSEAAREASLRQRQEALVRHLLAPVFGRDGPADGTASTPGPSEGGTQGPTPIPPEYAVTGLVEPRKLAPLLRLSVTRLAELLQVERGLLVAEPNSTAAQDALVPLATVVGKQLWFLGGDRQALAEWFHSQPLVLLEERTPLELVAAGEIELLEFDVERMLNGVYA